MDLESIDATRKKDVTVALEVFGLNVVGVARVTFYPAGEISIDPMKGGPRWWETSIEPVCLDAGLCRNHPNCEHKAGWPEEHLVYGHNPICLDVVPNYHTKDTDALKVWDWAVAQGWSVMMTETESHGVHVVVSPVRETPVDEEESGHYTANADTRAEAICEAVLAARRGMTNSEEVTNHG